LVGFSILDDGPASAQGEFDVMKEVAFLTSLRIPFAANGGGIHPDHVNPESGRQPAFPLQRRISDQRTNSALGPCVGGVDESHEGKVQVGRGSVDGKFSALLVMLQSVKPNMGSNIEVNFVYASDIFVIFLSSVHGSSGGWLPKAAEKCMGNPVSSMELLGSLGHCANAE
jgi:hypothetical protein